MYNHRFEPVSIACNTELAFAKLDMADVKKGHTVARREVARLEREAARLEKQIAALKAKG